MITGGTSGIGLACAQKFYHEGYQVVITGRDESRLSAAMASMSKAPNTAVGMKADVSIEEDCKRVVQTTLDKYGRIDVLINNAGISMRALFEDLDLKVIRQVMDTNFWGAVYCTKYALPSILANKGSVVGVSSIAGKKGLPGRTGYSSSKFALEGFLETLRTENLKKDLHVLVACPGFTASRIRQTALAANGHVQGESPRDEQKMMSAEEVANAIFVAVKKRKRDLILTFNGKLTVFLNKIIPGWLDKIVYNHMAKEPDSPFK
ncbi:MAG: SDR family oxidoreductase [Bacteroidota bacterium]